ncbi:taurine catabolism dioxygenase [Fomitiporia mediterranea MF3/22]|uniref:taurine catabolism dioxygenase n=1 Tax=Fomitiporia mediterranea (strain MF3/22) TaxID=694068 RepID=UPI00044078F9|nr:taurine catabolism dioxygenase [Fomitiporia mediterranea MF3/22]EJD08433.1 taurine catabolism dioxygenase [Fomitiporia mediterranea MF3/22]
MVADQKNGASHTNGTDKQLKCEPLVYSGSLDEFKSFDVTTIIGREFPDVQLSNLLKSPDSERLIKDLAITISQRGVVFFRNQDLDLEQQKELVDKIGRLAGRPETSGLHVHPLYNSPDNTPLDDTGKMDRHVYVISSKTQDKLYATMAHRMSVRPTSELWHSDITFENVPSDYSCLKITKTPTTGGDTLWASGCEVYDRMSPSVREFLTTLTATHAQPVFKRSAAAVGCEIVSPRGSPDNSGDAFEVSHPVVRTNPVTGWRSIYAVGLHCRDIDGLTKHESDRIKEYFDYMITHHHDLQVRFRWNPNDIAIWDNRSVFHSGTPDLVGEREGRRTTSVGERPYFDPASMTRREAMAKGTIKLV